MLAQLKPNAPFAHSLSDTVLNVNTAFAAAVKSSPKPNEYCKVSSVGTEYQPDVPVVVAGAVHVQRASAAGSSTVDELSPESSIPVNSEQSLEVALIPYVPLTIFLPASVKPETPQFVVISRISSSVPFVLPCHDQAI